MPISWIFRSSSAHGTGRGTGKKACSFSVKLACAAYGQMSLSLAFRTLLGVLSHFLRRLQVQIAGGVLKSAKVITHGAAISTCEKATDWQGAIGLFSGLAKKSLQANVISCSAAVSACEKSISRWNKALLLLNLAWAIILCPDVIMYSASISSCAESAKWLQAQTLLCDAEGLSLRPNTVTYGAHITATGHAAAWRQGNLP